MKSIKELEQKIEFYKKEWEKEMKNGNSNIAEGIDENLYPLQEILKQTIAIKEMIEKIFRDNKWLWIGEDDEINLEKSVIELKEELLRKINIGDRK